MIDTYTVQKQWERSSGKLTAVLLDEAGLPVAKTAMTALTLTLYDQATRAILNNRRNQPVLDANNCTMGATDGTITWAIQPADMACLSGGNEETHVALFTAKWAANAKEHAWTVLFPIENLPYV